MVRIQVALNPWADEYGDGYQATLAIMAFASGGLFGRGIGNSTMKYSYLPEAHNDYILAIIGEEVGFVGTVLFFLVFAMLIYSAFRIAEQATDRRGALMASGSAVILAVQFLINALGILNVFPMTGKPLPFISYGGSSIIVSLMLAGLILRVSYESAAVRALPLWMRVPPACLTCAASDLRVTVLPSWMALRPTPQPARVSERRRKVVLSAPLLAMRAADIIESI